MQPTAKRSLPSDTAVDGKRPTTMDDLIHSQAATSSLPARRVVLAEDDPEQLLRLAGILSTLRPSWQVVATAPSVATLQQMIEMHVPNLLLMDVHLLDGRSLDTLHALPYPLPVVLVSGDPHAAVDAFEQSVIDYVLKPVTPARLERALARVDALPLPGSEPQQATPPRRRWLTARRGQASAVIQLGDVLYFQAQTKYTRAVLRESEAILNRGLGQVEEELDAAVFMRIHRSTIINIGHASVLMRDDLGRLKLQMRGRSEWLFVSKPYEKHFRA